MVTIHGRQRIPELEFRSHIPPVIEDPTDCFGARRVYIAWMRDLLISGLHCDSIYRYGIAKELKYYSAWETRASKAFTEDSLFGPVASHSIPYLHRFAQSSQSRRWERMFGMQIFSTDAAVPRWLHAIKPITISSRGTIPICGGDEIRLDPLYPTDTEQNSESDGSQTDRSSQGSHWGNSSRSSAVHSSDLERDTETTGEKGQVQFDPTTEGSGQSDGQSSRRRRRLRRTPRQEDADDLDDEHSDGEDTASDHPPRVKERRIPRNKEPGALPSLFQENQRQPPPLQQRRRFSMVTPDQSRKEVMDLTGDDELRRLWSDRTSLSSGSRVSSSMHSEFNTSAQISSPLRPSPSTRDMHSPAHKAQKRPEHLPRSPPKEFQRQVQPQLHFYRESHDVRGYDSVRDVANRIDAGSARSRQSAKSWDYSSTLTDQAHVRGFARFSLFFTHFDADFQGTFEDPGYRLDDDTSDSLPMKYRLFPTEPRPRQREIFFGAIRNEEAAGHFHQLEAQERSSALSQGTVAPSFHPAWWTSNEFREFRLGNWNLRELDNKWIKEDHFTWFSLRFFLRDREVTARMHACVA